MLQQSKAHHDVRHPLAARSISDLLHVFHQSRNIQKLRHWIHLAGFFIDHHGSTNATVRVTTARYLAPFCLWTMHEICKVSKRSHQREREPIARGFSDTDLVLHIVSKVRQGVALLQPALFSDLFITSSK